MTKSLEQYIFSTIKFCNEMDELRECNWISAEDDGSLFGYKYKPTYMANGYDQSTKHPDEPVFSYALGKLSDTGMLLKDPKAMLYRLKDLENTHDYDYEAIRDRILPDLLHDAYNVIAEKYSEFLNFDRLSNTWLCCNSYSCAFLFDEEPKVCGGGVVDNKRAVFVGAFPYMKDDKDWPFSKIKLVDAIKFLKETNMIKSKPSDAFDEINQSIEDKKSRIRELTDKELSVEEEIRKAKIKIKMMADEKEKLNREIQCLIVAGKILRAG